MNIGWHGYEPVLGNIWNTSAPNGVWMTYLFEYFKENGHKVFWFGQQHGVNEHDSFEKADLNEFWKMDVMIFSWRWWVGYGPRYTYRNLAYRDQMQLLKDCYNAGIRIVIHDQDMSIEKQDMDFLKKVGATLTMPALNPPEGYQSLMYPVWKPVPAAHKFIESYRNRVRKICYIGNDYGRYDLMKRYLGNLEDIKQIVYGNWKEKSRIPGYYEKLHCDFPYTKFLNRLDQRLTIPTLSENRATIHFAKPEYMEHQLIAIRWIEAVLASTPAFVPLEFGFDFVLNVGNSQDIVEVVSLPNIMLLGLIQQINFLNEICDNNAWLKILKGQD